MNEERRKQEALFRYSVLGALVSAELEHGDVRALCEQQAERWYRKADGRRVKLSPRTIESWHYDYRANGLEGLKPTGRCDAGRSRSIRPEVAEQIIALKRENPRRSIRRIIRMLERAKKVHRRELTKSSVHRLLCAQGISERPARHEERERRAFRHAFAGDCWMADVMHGAKALDAQGVARKVYLHVFIDSATRFVTAAAWRFGERAVDFESVFRQGLTTRGVPRVLYVDNGAAQTADSLADICAELGVHLRHCAPYDAAAKGAVERFNRTARDELCDELPDEPMPLSELNALLWAWLSRDYHRREHGGTGRVPLEHWLEQAERLRKAPDAAKLHTIFLHRTARKVRTDHTVRYHRAFLEVFGPSPGDEVELRFDPEVPFEPSDATTLPAVYAAGVFVCDTVVLRVLSNTLRRRRNKPRLDAATEVTTDIDPLAQVLAEQAHKTRPPASATDDNAPDKE
jgi:transposase InsO family protein